MNKLHKKALSILTTCAMTISMSNPLLAVAAEKIVLEDEMSNQNLLTAANTAQSQCNLSSLSVTGLELSPEFSADVLDYTLADLAYNKASITVNATAETEGSTVEISYTNFAGLEKTASSSGLVSGLKYGRNIINVKVTSADSTESKTYTITVNRKAALKSLTATIGGKELVLTPKFSAAKYEYQANIVKGNESVLINAESNSSSDIYAKIKVNGVDLAEGGNTVALNGSTNNIAVSVVGDANQGESIYNLIINEMNAASLNVTTNVEGAMIRLIDSDGLDVSGNGTYTGLLSGGEYKLIVTKFGYIAKSQTITLSEEAQSVNVELQKAPANSLTQVSSEWKNFRGNDMNMGITNAKTPRNSTESEIKWTKKLGTGWSAAPSVQIVVDDAVVVMSGKKIYKLSKVDGNILAESDMVQAPSYGYTPPIYVDGMIIAPLGSGTVQAFNAKTLESLWVSESFGGQALSPIASSDGYVYLGFWNSETRDADFVCLSITDEDTTKTDETKYASWKMTVKGGFYWAGAYITGDTLVIGTDDGESGYEGTSHVYTLNKNTGAVIDSIETIGDQRSTISYDKTLDRIFFTTKAGYLYSIKVNADGTFDDSTLKSFKAPGQCTSTPTVYNGRVYYGTGVLNGNSDKLIVADASTLNTIYEVPLAGYPQASVLVSTAYAESENGKVYIYCTYNAAPGGIVVIEDSPGQTTPIYSELFDVPSSLSQYCIASPICDSDGTIYYKNDSANVIAIAKKDMVNVTFDADNGTEATVKAVEKDSALEYAPENPTKEGYTFVGWFRDVDDVTTKYQPGQAYTKDVTYTAKYAHVTMIGAQAKLVVNDTSGIRFGTKIYGGGDEIVEKGTLIIPANNLAEGEVLTLDTPNVAKSVGKVNYEVNEQKNYVVYLGTLVGMPRSLFDREITASSYVIYKDKAGNTYTVYCAYPNDSTTINKLLGE